MQEPTVPTEPNMIKNSPHQEVLNSWARGISGRRVDFPSDEGLAWGIELTIPLDNDRLRNIIKAIYGIDLPKHIDTIIYLDVSPQESLPKSQRNIRTKKWSFLPSQLEVLAQKTVSNQIIEKLTKTLNFSRPSDLKRQYKVQELISDVFGNNKEEKEKFNKHVAESRANKLVIVHGHGGFNSIIGEQYDDGTNAPDGTPIQKKGNSIHIEEVLDRYNDPEKYAAILLHNCHSSDEQVVAKKVPVFMPVGHVGGIASMMKLNRTRAILPNK